MGGGLPISSVIGRAEILDRASPGTLGGTYGGNPVACASALATIRQMEDLGLNARARRTGEVIRRRFEAIAQRVPEVTDIRGLGAMMAIEFCVDGDLGKPAGAMVREIAATCQHQGLVIIPAGLENNVIRVLAPLVISDEMLNRGLDILESSISSHTGAKSQVKPGV
jgi:4-aminobutyrate aminotransferase/(S)-3-amino-2-methylpropionate transaminase